jgi:type 2 lantibiotic biosynthesis protein LanM
MIIGQMEFSKQDLIRIIEKASTIEERLSGDYILDNLESNSTIINSKIEWWCEVVAQGDWEKFEKRLDWDNLNVNEIRCALSCVHLSDQESLPDWVQVLNESMKAASLFPFGAFENSCLKENGLFRDEKPFPFQEVFWPFIYIAKKELSSQTGHNYDLLELQGHIDLERSLLLSLVYLCGHTLEFEFSIFRSSRQSTLMNLLKKRTENQNSQKEYKAFITSLLTGDFLSFFKKYSVLARLVSVVTNIWIEESKKLLLRLGKDLAEIQKSFQSQADLGKVTAFNTNMSDRHAGSSVAILTFSSGLKIVYKPKDTEIEKTYFEILDWCNHQKADILPFKILNIISRSTYSWVEYVEHLPCKNQNEIENYYKRSGMLLMLVYAFGGTDFHNENIIAHGEYPVLIDMETIIRPRIRDLNDRDWGQEARSIASQVIDNSVLSTGLLPLWIMGNGGQSFDISGMGGVSEDDTPYLIPEWKNINSDNMSLASKFAKSITSNNTTRYLNNDIYLKDYTDIFIEGFKRMYYFFIKYKDDLLASNSPLRKLENQRVRIIFRPTLIYSFLLDDTLTPKYTTDGVDREIQFDLLCRAMIDQKEKSEFWPIIAEEKKDLLKMDVPLFSTLSSSSNLEISNNKMIEKCFEETSYQRAINQIRQLSLENLEAQIELINSALYSRFNEDVHGEFSIKNIDSFADSFNSYNNNNNILDESTIIENAISIAKKIQKKAICASDSSVTWIAPQYIPNVQRLQVMPVGDDLYNGNCGIALFMGALEKVTGGAGFRELAMGALQPICLDLQHTTSSKIVTNLGIGGGVGSGSVIYTLVRVSQFLKEDSFLENAKQLASLITIDSITKDRNFGVISGSAGAILGLLTLYKVHKDQEIIDKAVSCGKHLLNNLHITDTGHKAWKTIQGKFMTGFAHGTAGIAYALLCLYRITGEKAFLEATVEANAYETSLFSSKTQNWPDLRQKKLSFTNSWCHGSSGIGLARVGGIDILNTNEIQEDIKAAINNLKQSRISYVDNLCCGNFGSVEFFLTTAQKLSQPQLLDLAMKRAAQIVALAQNRGDFSYGESIVYKPGFFQGASGIGYQLLRLAYPNQLPSVLLWE